MTAHSTSRQFIRFVRTDDVRRVYGRHGARLPGLMLQEQLTVGQVRALAQEELQRGDNLYPTRPKNVADDLEKLAAHAETRLLSVSDEPVYSAAEIALLQEAEKQCRARSPLLHEFAEHLAYLTADWRSVGRMQAAAEVLNDVDLLVPGIAERLRPLLAIPQIGADE